VVATVFRSFSAGTSQIFYDFVYGLCIEFRQGHYHHPSELFPMMDRRELSVELRDAGSLKQSDLLLPLKGEPGTIEVDAGTVRGVHWVLALLCFPQLNIAPIPIYLRAVDNKTSTYAKVLVECLVTVRPFGIEVPWVSHDGHKAEIAAFSRNAPNNYQTYLPKEMQAEGFPSFCNSAYTSFFFFFQFFFFFFYLFLFYFILYLFFFLAYFFLLLH
jgi:hypothetical protein